MKKILLLLVCLIAGWQFAFAEEPALYDTVRAKLDSIFEYVDKFHCHAVIGQLPGTLNTPLSTFVRPPRG